MTIICTDVDGTATERPLHQAFVEIMYKQRHLTNEDRNEIKKALKISNWPERVKEVAAIIFRNPLPIDRYYEYLDNVIENVKPNVHFKKLVEYVNPRKIYAFSGSPEDGVKKWLEKYFPEYYKNIKVQGTVLEVEKKHGKYYITGKIKDMWDGERRADRVAELRTGELIIGLGNDVNDCRMLGKCDIGIYFGDPKDLKRYTQDIKGYQNIFTNIDDFYNFYDQMTRTSTGSRYTPMVPPISPRTF